MSKESYMSKMSATKKSDARVRYTKRVIKESFLSLLKVKPVNKITVKEVCEKAELNRATFYAHYSDCFALLESIEQEILDDFSASLKLINSFDVTGLIEGIYEMVKMNQEACEILIFSDRSPSLLGRMIALARKDSILAWKKQLPHASRDDLEMLYTHLSNGLMHVVVDGYKKYKKDDIIRFVNSMVSCSLEVFEG
ncbi:MAG: hypothetical protein IKE94_10545 [Aeriscardovia sp.]|nr:hypothetical protein [Aeriscardovia sp.]MBR3241253.1 TetR/AcrR family transcriptional regulator [Parasporobacterium sp.]